MKAEGRIIWGGRKWTITWGRKNEELGRKERRKEAASLPKRKSKSQSKKSVLSWFGVGFLLCFCSETGYHSVALPALTHQRELMGHGLHPTMSLPLYPTSLTLYGPLLFNQMVFLLPVKYFFKAPVTASMASLLPARPVQHWGLCSFPGLLPRPPRHPSVSSL